MGTQHDSVSFSNIVRRTAQSELIHILESIVGSKELFIDECLMKPLDRICGASMLRDHEIAKIYKFDETAISLPIAHQHQRVCLLRPSIQNSRLVASSVISTSNGSQSICINVIFVPKSLYSCERLFEEMGVYGRIRLFSCNMSLIPLESDLFSLEMPEVLPSIFFHNSYSTLPVIARSIWEFQSLFGPVPQTIAIGRSGAGILKLLDTFHLEFESNQHTESHLSHLIIIDRDVDFCSVFLSGLTYESLLDECFGINCSFSDVPTSLVVQPPPNSSNENRTEEKPAKKTVRILLTDEQETFGLVRHRHFSTVLPLLSSCARQLQAGFDKRNQLDSVAEFKEFVSTELRDLKKQQKALAMHINICEAILNNKSSHAIDDILACENSIMNDSVMDSRRVIGRIEDLLCQQLPEYTTLSLICLLSLLQGGLISKDYTSLRSQFLHSYGHQALYLWHALKQLGILVEKQLAVSSSHNLPGVAQNLLAKTAAMNASSSSTSSGSIIKKFELHAKTDNLNMKNPSDMSYVFNGLYVPLTCKLVENILQMGYMSVQDDLSRHLPHIPVHFQQGDSRTPVSLTKTVMVYFVGGVTYAEIACLKLLGRLRGYKFIVGTSHVINRAKLFSSLMDS